MYSVNEINQDKGEKEGRHVAGIVVLYKVVTEGIIHIVTFKQRLAGGEAIWRRRVSGNGNSTGKGSLYGCSKVRNGQSGRR